MQPAVNLHTTTNSAQDSDYALAREAAHGAMTSIGDLYVRHSGRVYAQCLRMTGDPADAEDLTHEVFVQLLRKIGSFRGDSQFSTWLYRLTVNQVLMHFRRTKGRKEELEIEALIEKSSALRQTSSALLLERIGLNAAMAHLPSGCRSVFLLFDVEGYQHEEIAHIFGCSVGNSKSQLHKARKKLRQLLQAKRPRIQRTQATQYNER
jgi:RNA polymerase sigma-70 factor (ECF subfamily)